MFELFGRLRERTIFIAKLKYKEFAILQDLLMLVVAAGGGENHLGAEAKRGAKILKIGDCKALSEKFTYLPISTERYLCGPGP